MERKFLIVVAILAIIGLIFAIYQLLDGALDSSTTSYPPILDVSNGFIWRISFIFLVGLGLWFTYKLKFLQILKIHKTSRLALQADRGDKEKNTISSFEAFCVGLGARVGVGNIAGVASAIAAGGPGAIFWMWIFAIVGSASSFMESTLSQIFKEKKSDGQYHGGPAYYALKGLRSRALSIVLALLIVITFGIGFVGVQASNSANALAGAFVFDHAEIVFGAIIAIAAAIIIFGGVKKVAKFSAKVVPPMAFLWLLFCAIVIICNYTGIVNAFELIFTKAFSLESGLGGLLGTVVMNGLKRGVFSNEAGLGSIANIAGTADVKHPVKQGMIQSFGTLVDTLVVCTFTAVVILSFFDTGVISAVAGEKAEVVQYVFAQTFLGDIGPIIVSLFMLLFAFTSLLGYYAMSESNMRFITENKGVIFAVRVLIIVVAFVSCIVGVSAMETICDTFMAAMGAVNMAVVFLLSGYVYKAYADWNRQIDEGIEDPVFDQSVLGENSGATAWVKQ